MMWSSPRASVAMGEPAGQGERIGDPSKHRGIDEAVGAV
jgi:hypothetical protein